MNNTGTWIQKNFQRTTIENMEFLCRHFRKKEPDENDRTQNMLRQMSMSAHNMFTPNGPDIYRTIDTTLRASKVEWVTSTTEKDDIRIEPWNYHLPTVASTSHLSLTKLWKAHGKVMRRLQNSFPAIIGFNWDNILLSGFSLGIALSSDIDLTEIDIHFYNLDIFHAKEKLCHCLACIFTAHRGKILCAFRGPKTLCITISSDEIHICTYVFHTTVFPCCADVVRRYKSGASQCGLIREALCFTPESLFAHSTGFILVNPQNSRTLLQYSCELEVASNIGFGLILPHLRLEAFTPENDVIRLPYIRIKYTSISDHCIFGDVLHNSGSVKMTARGVQHQLARFRQHIRTVKTAFSDPQDIPQLDDLSEESEDFNEDDEHDAIIRRVCRTINIASAETWAEAENEKLLHNEHPQYLYCVRIFNIQAFSNNSPIIQWANELVLNFDPTIHAGVIRATADGRHHVLNEHIQGIQNDGLPYEELWFQPMRDAIDLQCQKAIFRLKESCNRTLHDQNTYWSHYKRKEQNKKSETKEDEEDSGESDAFFPRAKDMTVVETWYGRYYKTFNC